MIYYRDPDGLPAYAASPKKTADGRDFLPVLAGDDLSFEDKPLIASEQVILRAMRVPGTVQLDERRITVVATRSDAFIDKVADVTTGGRVKKASL